MRKLAAIPFLFLYSCIFFEVPSEIIVEPTFSPIDDVSGDYTTATMLFDISDIPCQDDVNSISDGNLTLDFNQSVFKGGSEICTEFGDWGTFPLVEGSNPNFLSTRDDGSISIWLSKPVTTFGLELKPSYLGEYYISVSFYTKTKLIGVVNKTIIAEDFDIPEAMLFAASTNGGFERIVIDGFNSEIGFSMAQFRYILNL